MAKAKPKAARYLALWRGINVGKAKRIAMADLRALVESLGYEDVRTLLNSGNAVFGAMSGTAKSHAAKIQAAVESELGVSANVIVKSAAEVADAIAENPLVDEERNASRMLILFTQDAPTLARLVPVAKQDWSPEMLVVGKHAAYMWFPDGIIDSQVAKAVDRELKTLGTSRNWATLQKLDALLKGEAA